MHILLETLIEFFEVKKNEKEVTVSVFTEQ